MKSKTSIILCSVLSLCATPAFSGTVWDIYGGLSFGAGAHTFFFNDDSETRSAQSFGAMFGLDLPIFRIGAEYNYLNASDAHANAAFLNAYFKMPSTVVQPYFGVGIGLEFGGKNDKYDIKFDTAAAYQGMFGVTFGVPTLPLKFDVEGRAIYIPDVFESGDSHPDVLHYEARVKLRYVF